MVRAKLLRLAVDLSSGALQWGSAQEALEARLRYLAGLLLVNMRLVIVEELELLGCELGRLKCHLKTVCGLWWLLDTVKVSSVYLL